MADLDLAKGTRGRYGLDTDPAATLGAHLHLIIAGHLPSAHSHLANPHSSACTAVIDFYIQDALQRY